MPIRSLCSWLPVCHRCCRRAISSSSLRLPSSEIPVGESTASCTSSAFERPVDGDTFPIGSLNPGGLSTNTEPRSDSSGTGIVRIAKDTNSHIRISRSGTIDRSTGIGGRLQNSRPTTTRRVNQGWWSTSLASGQNQPSDQSGTDEVFQPSSTVILRGVGTAVLEADIRRLVPRKIHFPNFRDDNDVVRVIPYRDIKSLDQRPIYHLTFATPAAATSFARSMTPIFSDTKRSEWPDVRFPPGSRPGFSRTDSQDSSILQQEHILQSMLATGGSAAGQCVLLTVCGIGGRRKSTGKLPRTHDIRIILEEKEVELCRKDLEMGGAGVQRIVQEKLGSTGNRIVVKADGRGLGAEGRWLIRCANESEAHRIVRELHMRAPWEGCDAFRAEVIH